MAPKKPTRKTTPPQPRRGMTPPGKAAASPRGGSPSKFRAAFAASGPIASFGVGRLVLLLAAFGLAGLAQYEWSIYWDGNSVHKGWYYFAVALVLFIVTLWPWRKIGSTGGEVPGFLEGAVLVLVFGVAAFFRIFRLDSMPPGVFFDQGAVGWMALRIIHEGYRPILWSVDEVFRNPPLVIYQLALWFLFFKASHFTLFLFFVTLSLISMVFIYWTFRQMVGPRVALTALFILAVMRWNINFSRNGFPTIQVPLYMFGTMAFLLHGLRTGKRWAFLVAGAFFAGGLYTYQAYKIFPLLLVVFGAYEFFHRREDIVRNRKNLLLFSLVFVVLIAPLVGQMFKNRQVGWRENSDFILFECQRQHSIKPFVSNVLRTAKMFNREGDWNERHNLPNWRMLDDVTAALFALGFFFALTRVRQRPYFFAVVGFLVMCLPCILSLDAAHANRMLGTTPFIALLAALPIGALWDRVRQAWKGPGEVILIFFALIEPLFLMGLQNYTVYFDKQALDNSLWTTGIWGGYSVTESNIGTAIGASGDKCDFYVSPRFADDPSTNFLTYLNKRAMKKADILRDLAPFQSKDPSHSAAYGFTYLQGGTLALYRSLYPSATLEVQKDLKGQTLDYILRVPAADIQAARGLRGRINGKEGHYPDFPNGLPAGPFHGTFEGCVFVDGSGRMQLDPMPGSRISLSIDGRAWVPGVPREMARGFHSIGIIWDAKAGEVFPKVSWAGPNIPVEVLGPDNLTSLPLDRGLLGRWYEGIATTGNPALVQWNPIIDFPWGQDFAYRTYGFCVRWEGTLIVPKAGTYGFRCDTQDRTKLTLDHRTVFDMGKINEGKMTLTAGAHPIVLEFRKDQGPILSLLWKRPGGVDFEVVPMTAFGKVR